MERPMGHSWSDEGEVHISCCDVAEAGNAEYAAKSTLHPSFFAESGPSPPATSQQEM